jgi:hypothetical protein
MSASSACVWIQISTLVQRCHHLGPRTRSARICHLAPRCQASGRVGIGHDSVQSTLFLPGKNKRVFGFGFGRNIGVGGFKIGRSCSLRSVARRAAVGGLRPKHDAW